MAGLLQIWSEHRDKLIRFAGVSVVAVLVTQSILVFLSAGLDWGGVAANLVAVTLGSIPGYLLNRRWVWQKTEQHSVMREVVPFWVYTILGLGVSTGLVAVADRIWGTTVSVVGASLLGFGILWIGKYLLLDRVLFGRADPAVSAV